PALPADPRACPAPHLRAHAGGRAGRPVALGRLRQELRPAVVPVRRVLPGGLHLSRLPPLHRGRHGGGGGRRLAAAQPDERRAGGRDLPVRARLLVEPGHRAGPVPPHGRAAARAAPGPVWRRGCVRVKRPLYKHPLVFFGIALYVFPYLVVALGKSTFNASEFLVWAIFATGINLLWGHTGDLSFGHGMFFGWGAYSAGLMSRQVPFVPFDLVFGAAVAMAVAWPLAKIIVRRATGIYFAMITLAVGEMFFFVAIRLTSITGGENGLGDIQLGSFFGIDLSSRVNFYYLSAWTAFIAVGVAWFVTQSSFGRVCRGI